MENKPEIKKDCFAYKNNNCTALNDLYCAKEKCSLLQACIVKNTEPALLTVYELPALTT